jgi:hypothetical protein
MPRIYNRTHFPILCHEATPSVGVVPTSEVRMAVMLVLLTVGLLVG